MDNSATTKVFAEVVELMNKIYLEDYGNPSSRHMKGVDAEAHLKDAREKLAATLKVNERNILFTSGGTESDNLALRGILSANQRRGKHIITSSIEHPAILETTEYLKSQGAEITYLPVNSYGEVEPETLRAAIRPDTVLVSVMHTNNEIGAVNNIEELGRIIKSENPDIYFHVDAVQGYSKARIYPKRMNIDLMSVSGHKIHGPKGIGFLYIGDKVKINPIIFGGGQQHGMRSGTENVPGIAGMALAAKMLYDSFDRDIDMLYELRQQLIEGLTSIEGVTVNGRHDRGAAPHIVSASVKGVRAEVLLHALEEKGIYVSSGSACASNKPAISGTLTNIGVPKDALDSTIRFSMSVENTREDIDICISAMEEIIPELRKYVRR